MYISLLFFFNDTATTEIYTLSLHDALPIALRLRRRLHGSAGAHDAARSARRGRGGVHRCARSESAGIELLARGARLRPSGGGHRARDRGRVAAAPTGAGL